MFTIFYSWQSDLNKNRNLYFIRESIDKAVKLAHESESVEAVRDEATMDVTGSPDIVQTLLSKIEACDMFIADVSLCYEHNDNKGVKKSPNPNVLIELGYAAHILGWDRIICVFNDEYGEPKDLPFDIEHNRLARYKLTGISRREASCKLAGIIVDNITKLRDKGPRAKNGASLFTVGTYDESSNKVIGSISPVCLEERVNNCLIDELSDKARRLVVEINNLSEKMAEEKAVCEKNRQDNEAFLKMLNFPAYEDLQKAFSTSAFEKNTKPVEAFCIDTVASWLDQYLSVRPDDKFFDFGSLTVTEFDFGIQKDKKYNGSKSEKSKYELYKELYKTLYQIKIRSEFVKTFSGLLFIPLAVQNISNVNDENIRIVMELEQGIAIEPNKDLVFGSLRDHRGRICHFGLVDELFRLPKTPMAEIEFSSKQSREPSFYFDAISGFQKAKETEDDYEANLRQYILQPVDTSHYSTDISSLRPGESIWFSGGILVKPVERAVKIRYSIHSTHSFGDVKGQIEFHQE